MSGTGQIFEIFRSERLVARAILGMSPDRCVVTFAPFEENRALGRPGFEQNTFRKSQVDAIHILSSDNHGYHYAELPQLCSKVAQVTATYRHVIAYGSSMGGYAAIRYGGWAGAHAALALSPQFTLDPRRRPFDRRWPQHAREIRFLHEHGREAISRAFVAYDPSDRIDNAHVRLLHTLTRVIPVPLPGSGHPSTGFLADLNMLHRIALEVSRETFDPDAFIAEASRRREESAQFHFVRALRARNLKERYRLITKAAARAPTHIGTLHALAETAIKVGLPEVALDALDSATRAEPGRAQFLRSLAHEKAGRLEQAIEIMEELCRHNTGSPHWGATLARLKRRRALQIWIYRPWQRIMGRHRSR